MKFYELGAIVYVEVEVDEVEGQYAGHQEAQELTEGYGDGGVVVDQIGLARVDVLLKYEIANVLCFQ